MIISPSKLTDLCTMLCTCPGIVGVIIEMRPATVKLMWLPYSTKIQPVSAPSFVYNYPIACRDLWLLSQFKVAFNGLLHKGLVWILSIEGMKHSLQSKDSEHQYEFNSTSDNGSLRPKYHLVQDIATWLNPWSLSLLTIMPTYDLKGKFAIVTEAGSGKFIRLDSTFVQLIII